MLLSRLWIVSFSLAAIFVVDGGSSARAQAPAPGGNKQPPANNNGFGNVGGVGGVVVPGGVMVPGVGVVGGFGGGGAIGGFGFGGGFPGAMPIPNGGVGLLGGVPGGGVPLGGGGGIGIGGAGAVRPRPAPRIAAPANPPKVATVDRELTFDIASDATFSKLQSSPTGLNYVDAKFDDIKVGQRLSLNPGKKADAARSDDVTGTVLAVNTAQRQVTIKVSVPADQAAAEGNTTAQTVMIRSQPGNK